MKDQKSQWGWDILQYGDRVHVYMCDNKQLKMSLDMAKELNEALARFFSEKEATNVV